MTIANKNYDYFGIREYDYLLIKTTPNEIKYKFLGKFKEYFDIEENDKSIRVYNYDKLNLTFFTDNNKVIVVNNVNLAELPNFTKSLEPEIYVLIYVNPKAPPGTEPECYKILNIRKAQNRLGLIDYAITTESNGVFHIDINGKEIPLSNGGKRTQKRKPKHATLNKRKYKRHRRYSRKSRK